MSERARRPSEAESGSELDELIDQWTHDRSAVRDRTLEIIRVAHLVMAPVVVGGLLVTMPNRSLLVSGLFFTLGMLGVLVLVPRRRQAGVLAVFDIVLIAFAGSTDAAIWVALLMPCLSAMTIGWLVGPRTTWGLWSIAAIGMAVAAGVADPPGGIYSALVFAASSASLNFNNLKILGENRDSVLRVADLVESLPVIVWESDTETGALTRAVGRVDELLGFGATEWRDMALSARVHPDDLDEYRLDPDDLEGVVREVRLWRADGSTLLVREVVRGVQFDDRRYFRGVILDISDEVAARAEVERLAAVFAEQSEPLVVVAARATISEAPRFLQVNPSFARLAGVDPDEAPGRVVRSVAPWLPGSLLADLDELVAAGRPTSRDDVEMNAPGGWRTFDYDLILLPDGAVAVQFTDVTERRQATEMIRHQAYHDPLTGLPNRTLLFDRLSQALARTTRDGDPVGLLLLDLNQFKEINDTLGHAHGDDLLTTVAERLGQLTRATDTVARLGGDEFAVVVSDAQSADLADVANRVCDAVKRPIPLGGIEVEVTASVGGAVAPVHGDDAHTLLQRADIAMYDAKRSGMPYRLYARDDDRHSVDRLTLMGELRRLLDGELRVWYQPKVDLRTGQAHEVEALARWQHSRLGLLGPTDFIEICEVSGVIADLTFAVLDEALATIAGWPGKRVAVNVPVRNLYDRGLPDAVEEVLRRHGVEPQRLILEITEREIMEDHRAVVDVLEELHDRGVRISIDDFGTGFSSLTHLRRLPVHEIKIDRSFISGMLDRENDYIIARSIIDLAHNLGHRVVAEGVEDTATLELLRGLGCDVAQGYLFARPGPAESIRARIDRGAVLGFADDPTPTAALD